MVETPDGYYRSNHQVSNKYMIVLFLFIGNLIPNLSPTIYTLCVIIYILYMRVFTYFNPYAH